MLRETKVSSEGNRGGEETTNRVLPEQPYSSAILNFRR